MILFYLLVALAPFANPPLIWRILGSTGTFKVLGGLCVIYVIVDLTRGGSIPAYFRSAQARFFAALFVFASVSYFAMSASLQNTTLLVYLDFVIFFFVIVTLVNSTRRLHWTLLASVLGIAYGSADIIREWLRFHSTMPNYRAGDSVGDGNYFSTAAALILPFVYLMIFNTKKNSEKLFFLGCLLISLVAIMLTGSRGGGLAIAVSLLYLIWHSRHRVRNLVLIAVVGLPLAIFVPVSPLHRMLHPPNGVNTEETRLEAWNAGLKMFESHPFFGVGLGNFKTLMPLYAAPGVDFKSIAHNTYIEYLAELGPLGLILFLAIVFFALRSLRNVRRRMHELDPQSFLYLTSLSLESGLIGFLVGACFLSDEYEKLFWVVIFLSICLPRFVPRVQRPAEAALETPTTPADIAFQEYARP